MIFRFELSSQSAFFPLMDAHFSSPSFTSLSHTKNSPTFTVFSHHNCNLPSSFGHLPRSTSVVVGFKSMASSLNLSGMEPSKNWWEFIGKLAEKNRNGQLCVLSPCSYIFKRIKFYYLWNNFWNGPRPKPICPQPSLLLLRYSMNTMNSCYKKVWILSSGWLSSYAPIFILWCWLACPDSGTYSIIISNKFSCSIHMG